MAKLKECSHCGEWSRKITDDRELCSICFKSMINHMIARLRFFGDTQKMVESVTGENIFETIDLPFATRD